MSEATSEATVATSAVAAKSQTARPTLRDLRRAEILDTAGELVASGGLGALTISALEKRLSFRVTSSPTRARLRLFRTHKLNCGRAGVVNYGILPLKRK